MSKRTRWYLFLVVAVLVMFVYSRFTSGWSDLEYYGGAAVLMILGGCIGFPWMELAPDGAWRRRSET